MATIGRRRAAGDLGRLKLSGLPAWLAWLFLPVLLLVGFKNRVGVLSRAMSTSRLRASTGVATGSSKANRRWRRSTSRSMPSASMPASAIS